MLNVIFSTDLAPLEHSISSLARQTGLGRSTVRGLLAGEGTIASLDKLRATLSLHWSWCGARDRPGTRLAQIREGRRLTQRGVATRLGVSIPTIAALELRCIGRVDTLKRYLRLLGRDHLLVGHPSPPKRLVPDGNDDAADRVFTPSDLASMIVDHFAGEMQGRVLDPARGAGAFYDALPRQVERLWCEIDEARDFLDWAEPVDWIITNPPWSRFKSFLSHAMRVSDNVVFLASLSHFSTRHRVELIRGAGFGVRRILLAPTPKEWPASGFQLAAAHLARGWAGGCEIVSLEDR